jgi:nitrate reductase assembly molybdenum cofactor insertion protein NarJ
MEKVLIFLSFFLGFLSVVMAFVLSWNTNKLVRTEDERAKNLIKETQKIIEKMDERLVEMQREHRETIQWLATLIKTDGQQTRELINKVLEKMPG